MPKKAYIGIDNVARKIKKGYIGVDGIARRIKKAYIGVGGIARPCWSCGELTYYGPISSLNETRSYLASTHVGDYALFGGGWASVSEGFTSTVEAYNTSLTKLTTTESMVEASAYPVATHVRDYALFRAYRHISAYDKYLIRTVIYTDSDYYFNSAAAHTNDYALFTDHGETIVVYDNSLTKIYTIASSKDYITSTYVGDLALLTDGSTIDVFSISLTQVNLTSIYLSVTRTNLAATHVGNYALFGGGASSYNDVASHGDAHSEVDAYNTSLTRRSAPDLSVARYDLAATHVGNYALFGGGLTTTGTNMHDTTAHNTVDVYTESLTKTTTTNLSVARCKLAATHVGDYALFGGGVNTTHGEYNTYTNTVEAYVII